jgi:dipeptidyl aminopeptidase/acylaminoacyl peptidase
MQKQLERAEKPVKLVKLKGEDHYLSTPQTRLECLKETLEFIDQYIGGQELGEVRPAPVEMGHQG